jgi:hypothetical protein
MQTMKKFNDVLEDIEKLVGLKLQSIREGAEITIEEMDWNAKRILLKASDGVRRSRPFTEMERLWKALCKQSSIHVDSELGGSGSSRNQPETILANLPYIEWFRYLRKKHLTLMGSPSHAFGTLKRMDDIAAEEMKQSIQTAAISSKDGGVAQMIVVSGDLGRHAETLEQVTGIKGQAVHQGVYEFSLPACRFLLVSDYAVTGNIPLGTYLVIEGNPPQQTTKSVEIAGQRYAFHAAKGLCLLYVRQD